MAKSLEEQTAERKAFRKKKASKKKAKRKPRTKKRTMVQQGHVSYLGRPTNYGAEVVAKALDYLENYDKKYGDAFPSAVGLARVVDRTRNHCYQWAAEKLEDGSTRRPEWADIMSAIQEVQELVLLNNGVRGNFNSTITSLVLGKHGYHKKVDNEMSGPGGGPIETKNKTLTVTGVESQHPDTK